MNQKKPKDGILLVVYGHPYYGRFAFNLAVSIKAVEFETYIAIAYHGDVLNHLTEDQKLVFDYLLPLDEKITPGFGTKVQLDRISPFENTIFLDADTVWLPRQKPSELFKALEPYEFTGITEGYYDIAAKTDHGNKFYYYWADINEIIEVYKPVHNVYQWRSEFLYFKKSKQVKEMFKKAREVYVNPKVKSIKHFSNNVPDELAFNIATAVIGIAPHQINWSPTYWAPLKKNFIPDFNTLYSYYLLSLGSNIISQPVKNVYNNVMSAACKKLQYQYLFVPHSKKHFDLNRLKM